MASLWQKKNSSLWCITYRENGRRRTRSLRTQDKREALKLKPAIETTLEERGAFVLHVSDRPVSQGKNPNLEEFWRDFYEKVASNRSPRTIEEYNNWFTQLQEFTEAGCLGDITRNDIESFNLARQR